MLPSNTVQPPLEEPVGGECNEVITSYSTWMLDWPAVEMARVMMLPSRKQASRLFDCPLPVETMLPVAASCAMVPGKPGPDCQVSSVHPSASLVNSLLLMVTTAGRGVAAACATNE